MKVAIIHDWFVTYAGAERVLEQMLKVFPQADVFSLVDFLPEQDRGFLLGKQVRTTLIQNLPYARSKYRNYLPLFPIAIEQLDLSGYDVIISSSHAVAKGVITGPDQLHVSYVNTPIRYAWDLQHQYLKESNLDKGLKAIIARAILHYIRMWDVRTANGVDYYLANSQFIARRIHKVYRREASVIYPPVNISAFSLFTEKEDFYLTASRMVPYKRIDLVVATFNQLKDKNLVVIGDGPEYKKIRSLGGSNIEFLGHAPSEVMRDYMQRARAFVFAAEEDFGITPVEAQACGTPVIAFGEGGCVETVIGHTMPNPTGVFFAEQTIESLVHAIAVFKDNEHKLTPDSCRNNAMRFSEERFCGEFSEFVRTVTVGHNV